MMKPRRTCYMCNKIIEPYEETVKIQQRGGRMKFYHETCIERERAERGYTNNLRTK